MILGICDLNAAVTNNAVIWLTNSPTSQDGNIMDDGSIRETNMEYLKCGDFEDVRQYYALMGFNLGKVFTNDVNIVGAYLCITIAGRRAQAKEVAPFIVEHIDFGQSIDYGDHSDNNLITPSVFVSFAYYKPPWQFNYLTPPFIDVTYDVKNAFENKKNWTLDSSDQWFQIRIRPNTLYTNNPTEPNSDYISIISSDYIDTGEYIYPHPYLYIEYTPPVPPDVPGGFQAITNECESTTITLKWTDVSREKYYLISRNTSGVDLTSTNIAVLGPNVTTYIDTNYVAGTTFYYWVRSSNDHGISGYSTGSVNHGSFIYPGQPDTPFWYSPDLQENGNAIKLYWNNVCNETSYSLYRSTASNWGSSSNIAGINKNITNYIDSYLLTGTTYYYWIIAYNAFGASNVSSYISESTGTNRLSSIPQIYGSTGINNTYNSPINILWNDVLNETSYVLYRSTTNDTATANPIGTTSSNMTNLIDTELLSANGIYYYWVRSFIGSTTAEDYSRVYIYTLPDSLQLRIKTESILESRKAILTWSLVSNVQKYRIYRSITPVFTPLLNSQDVSKGVYKYEDNTIEYNRTFYYNESLIIIFK